MLPLLVQSLVKHVVVEEKLHLIILNVNSALLENTLLLAVNVNLVLSISSPQWMEHVNVYHVVMELKPMLLKQDVKNV